MITEKDIFNYFFFPNLVDEEKKEIINNSSDYQTLIELYKSIKSASDMPVSTEVKNRLSEKIQLYNYKIFFRLKPVTEIKEKRKRDLPLLAAASASENTAVFTKSFLDENNKCLVRVIKSKEGTRIYAFSSDNIELKNFKIKIFPSGKEFIMKDNSAPLELTEELEYDEVLLELI